MELSPTKQALLALKQMQSKLRAIEQAKYEPIAVVGMGCRFPGANNPEEFWQLLIQGKDSITDVPGDRWNSLEYDRANSYGGFVPYLKEFDAQFFRIAPREAASLDPQHRLLLEVSWEALENGGIAPDRLQGSQTGVFIGICSVDYWHQLLCREAREIDAYLTTGNTHSLAAGRISHFFGFTAPSIAIDTACSSSLVAVHLAIKSLRDRECNLALVGGVNRLISPKVSQNFSQAKMLSPDGRCQTFDRHANGFVRSEGCGVAILKRLSDAIASSDNIKAILLGSAVNQDGRTSSITTPNSLSQQAVILQALANSKIEPDRVGYLETHGTGTSLGDTIEIEALSSVFATEKERSPTKEAHAGGLSPLVLGAVKTNIGHLEGASGIASLIKAVLTLENEIIPANLHLKQPNERVDWQNLPFVLPQQAIAWQKTTQPRIAGVSAFGFSGTNAHVIVAEAPEREVNNREIKSLVNIFSLSTRNNSALRQLAADYANYLQTHSHLVLEDICYTANTGRTHFNYRLALTASSLQELQAKLSQFISQQIPPELWQGKANTNYREITASISNNGEHMAESANFTDISVLPPEVRDICLELGIKSVVEKDGRSTIAIDLDHQPDDRRLIMAGLARLYVLGVNIDWLAWEQNYSYQKVTLPTYPFQRQRYWID